VRLTVAVDVIAIALRIPIILAAVHNGADHSTEDASSNRTCSGTDARENRTGDGSGACSDYGSSGGSGNCVIIDRVRSAATEREACSGGG
jgi:uncharacterized protein involved in type VI secretion and phage assembly